MNKIIIILGILLISTVLVLANENHQSEIEEGKKLVESAISCGKLNDEQLEAIGNYYMEQMHPGEAHEYMDKMMGGEGSESLKKMHINMGKSIYCNEDVGMGNMMDMMADANGMMGNNMMSDGMMNGMMGNNMMSGRMMNMMAGGNEITNGKNTMYGYGNYNLGFAVISWITYILMIMLIASVVYWLIKSANRKK